MTDDLDGLGAWIGRAEERSDVAAAAPLAALSATLDRDDPRPMAGDELPPGAHWLYFLSAGRQSDLGPDGHPARGGFSPPVPLPRRMWAGGRIEYLASLGVGETISRISTIDDVTAKEGRTGPLVFVRVGHRISGALGPALIEEQSIVYRGEAGEGAASAAPVKAPAEARWRRTIEPDPVLLFRYSALTFNGHRIHYDRRYVTEVEGYPGLIVHGPLLATLLMDLCRRHRPDARIRRFDYRAVRPVFDTGPFAIAGQPSADGASAQVWAADGDGALAMTGTVEFAG